MKKKKNCGCKINIVALYCGVKDKSIVKNLLMNRAKKLLTQ